MKKINRRDFLKISAMGGAALVGCASKLSLGVNRPTSVSAAFPATDTYLPIVTNKSTGQTFTGQIIADHTVVGEYNKIPQEYKNQITKMWANIPGESHAKGFWRGCELLQQQDTSFAVSVSEGGPPEGYTDQHLRISRTTWGDVAHTSDWISFYGEEDWFTSSTAILRTKNHIKYCNTHNLAIAAMGFAWCWDMTLDWTNSLVDPVYHVKWYGDVGDENENSLYDWGLDAEDTALTGNSICIDTYLNATVEYMNFCQENGYPTKVFFTTGPVDDTQPDHNIGESGYQRELKHQHIRDFVMQDKNRILFDYADILCWSNTNELETVNWTDHIGVKHDYPFIHPDNVKNIDGSDGSNNDYHIGERGALRLAKALWWMLARIAGWDGN